MKHVCQCAPKLVQHLVDVRALSDCAVHINKRYDVDGLSRCLPRRVKALVDAEGKRLRS